MTCRGEDSDTLEQQEEAEESMSERERQRPTVTVQRAFRKVAMEQEDAAVADSDEELIEFSDEVCMAPAKSASFLHACDLFPIRMWVVVLTSWRLY
jgi:hypothetical protein